MIRRCPQCGKQNRIPARHVADTGRCGACKTALPPASSPIEIAKSADFDELIGGAEVPVLVDFWAPWCGPCKMAAPYVAQAAQSLAGQAVVLKVDTDRLPELAARYGVRGIPMFAVFRGGQLRQQKTGLATTAELTRLVAGA